jgi:hypothetical protein
MARKPFPFTTMSDVICMSPGCSKKIKMNLVSRKTATSFKCFKHWIKDVLFEKNRKKNRK